MKLNKKNKTDKIPDTAVDENIKDNDTEETPDVSGASDTVKMRLPKICIWLYIVAGISLAIYFLARFFSPFADFFNLYISSVVRGVLAWATNLLPFSLAEAFLISLVPLFVVIIVFAIKKYSDSWHNSFVFIGKIGSVAAVLLIIFVFAFGTGYFTAPLDEKLDIDREDVSVEELKATTEYIAGKVNEEVGAIGYKPHNFSVMPYSYLTMNEKLNEAYKKVAKEYDFIPSLTSYTKPVVMSKLMSYTHITGVYSFFTGEANINVDFPDYTVPFTAAHEMAHQRGIAREDEANFVAYLVCIASDDPYIRYSGYLNMYEYLASSLYGADSAAYTEIKNKLSADVRYEMAAYSVFFNQYRNSTVSKVSGAVNDTYLQMQGTVGTKSYGMVVDLAVAYYREGISE